VILTDIELNAEIDAKRLQFDPPLVLKGPRPQLQTSTIDLRLGNRIREFKSPIRGVCIAVDPGDPQFDIDAFVAEYTIPKTVSDEEHYDLPLGAPLLAHTLELVSMPAHLSGRVEGRSSLARLGLTVHNTAPYIHPGYSDYITLELFHHGTLPFRLRPGMRICQLIVERVGSPPLEPYPGQYRQG